MVLSLEKSVILYHDANTLFGFICFCTCAVNYSTNAIAKVKSSI